MPDSRSSSSTALLVATVVAAGLSLPGCKKAVGTDSPTRDIEDWSLSQIEAELARNDDVLADAGIMVAVATPPRPATDAPAPGPHVEEPSSEDDGGAGDDGYDPDIEPYPEPAPEPEPMAAEEEMDAPAVAQYSPEPDLAERGRSSRRDRERRSVSRRRDRAPTHCEKVCDLAESTCDLEIQICELAERHPEEPRYATACERAEQQCTAATEACDDCEEP